MLGHAPDLFARHTQDPVVSRLMTWLPTTRSSAPALRCWIVHPTWARSPGTAGASGGCD